MAAGKRVVVIAYPFLDGRGALAGKLDAAIVARLRAIDPDAEIVYAPLGSNDRLYGAMKSAPPEILDSLITEFPAEYLEALPRAEVLHCLYVPVDVLKRAPHLRWISNIGSGTDQYTQTGVLGSQVVLTSAKGVAASSIAEFAMSQLLVLTKGTIERLDNQRSRRWAKVRKRDLRGMSLGVIGLGEIGKHATRLAKAFGMQVLALRRRLPDGTLPEGVERMFAVDEMDSMLAQCDAVLIAAAYTPETIGLFDHAAFAAMRKGAWLVNVARGGIVDERALADALSSGHLAGAAFDVFEDEPLPPDNRLWNVPNLLISAHESIGMTDYPGATFERFVTNFKRYVHSEPLLGVVDAHYRY